MTLFSSMPLNYIIIIIADYVAWLLYTASQRQVMQRTGDKLRHRTSDCTQNKHCKITKIVRQNC